jgi:biopolymer transport protein ExbD
MALAKRDEGSKVSSEINVTPMVDVMLVLLIIFMVVTPMLQKGISVDMAKVNNPEQMPDADKEDALLVSITRDGKVYFGSEQTTADNLTTKVKDRRSGRSRAADGSTQDISNHPTAGWRNRPGPGGAIRETYYGNESWLARRSEREH